MQTALVFKNQKRLLLPGEFKKQTSGDCSSSGIHHYAAGDKVKSSESSGVQESNNLNEESFNIIDLDNEDIGFSGNQSGDDPYARLQSHLDGLNVPPGIEVSVPWFINEEVNNLSSSTSTNMSNSDIQLTLNLVDSVPSKYSIKPVALKAFGNQATSDFKSKPLEKFLSGSVKLYTEPEKPKAINDWKKVSDLKRKYSTSNHEFTSGSKFKSLSSSSTTVASDVHKAVTAIDLDLSLASEGAMNIKDDNSSLKIQVLDDLDSSIPFEYLSGVSDVLEPWFTSFDESLLYSSMLSEYAEHFDPNAGNSSSTSAQTASSSCTIVYDDPQVSLKKFDLFKQFDTVEDHSDHLFSNNVSVNQLSKDWAKKIQDEWRILEKDLPDTIFVRVYESRMDLLRAVIIGAEGTPYHDGLFFFDMFFPPNYPNVPPKVKYHSGGLRINPNLYNCGKVCLSLLNTWSGDKQEMWTPCVSTVLQILVSIQGLILNAKPFFNEPGYSGSCGTPSGEIASMHYNERTLIYSLKTMVYSIQKPPKHFEDFIAGHFLKRADDIFVACKAYLNGAQVGCLVKGGVQDVEAGDKSCSDEFKKDLATYLKTFVNTIAYVGVTDCDKIISENESLHKLQVWRQGFCFRH